MIRMRLQKTLKGNNHCGESALHVRRATAIKLPVDDGGFEWWAMPPLCIAGRYDVGMTGKTKYGRCAATARPEVRYVIKLHCFAFEPESCQPLGQDALAAGIIGRHGHTTDKVAEKVDYRFRHGIRFSLNK